jgi:dienelactone hydrolase
MFGGCGLRFAIALIAMTLGPSLIAAPLEARARRGTFRPTAAKIEPIPGRFFSDAAPIDEFHCVPHSDGKSPVVMLLHGCAPNGFGVAAFRQMCVSLAEHGYYAMFIEYYGAEGAPNCRSLAMIPSVSLTPETPLPDDLWERELVAARDSLANNPKADATRLALIGFSFGGTLAIISATLHPSLAAAIIDYYGFSNERIEDAAAGVARFPPTLILQGDSDSRAHVVDSIHLHNVIAKHQPATEIRIYPRVEHGFNFRDAVGYDREASEDAWSHALSFLDRHLK